jgi:hypothetical protein
MDPRTAKMLAERRQPTARSGLSGITGALGLGLPAYRAAVEKWLRAHWGLAAIVSAAVIFAMFAGARHIFVTRPALEREYAELENLRVRQRMETEFDARQASLDGCLATTDTERAALWEAACRERRRPRGCSLPRDVVEQQQRAYTDRRNDCMRRFSLSAEVQ